MADHVQRNQWDHTSATLAAIFNANRGPNSPVVYPAQLNPYRMDEPEPKGPQLEISFAEFEQILTNSGAVKVQ